MRKEEGKGGVSNAYLALVAGKAHKLYLPRSTSETLKQQNDTIANEKHIHGRLSSHRWCAAGALMVLTVPVR